MFFGYFMFKFYATYFWCNCWGVILDLSCLGEAMNAKEIKHGDAKVRGENANIFGSIRAQSLRRAYLNTQFKDSLV